MIERKFFIRDNNGLFDISIKEFRIVHDLIRFCEEMRGLFFVAIKIENGKENFNNPIINVPFNIKGSRSFWVFNVNFIHVNENTGVLSLFLKIIDIGGQIRLLVVPIEHTFKVLMNLIWCNYDTIKKVIDIYEINIINAPDAISLWAKEI